MTTRVLFALCAIALLASCREIVSPRRCVGVVRETDEIHPAYPDSVVLECSR